MSYFECKPIRILVLAPVQALPVIVVHTQFDISCQLLWRAVYRHRYGKLIELDQEPAAGSTAISIRLQRGKYFGKRTGRSCMGKYFTSN